LQAIAIIREKSPEQGDSAFRACVSSYV